MPNPEAITRDRIKSSKRNAANCEKLAAKASNDADRVRWLGMAEFWRNRARAVEAETAQIEI